MTQTPKGPRWAHGRSIDVRFNRCDVRSKVGTTSPKRVSLIAALAGLSLVAAACTSGNTNASSHAQSSHMTVVLAWYPTAEYGGLYAAESQHYFQKEGLKVTITPGGPNVNSTTIVAAGRAQVGFAGDNSAVLAAAASYPLVEIGTEFEIDPEGIEYHLNHPISSLSQLSGQTLYVTPGDPAWEWIQKTYHVHNVKLGPFNYPLFIHNPNSFEFGFVTDDLPTLAASHVKAGYILPSHFGYNDNGDVLFVTRSYAQSNSGTLKRFMLALEQGWSYYRNHYKSVDPVIHQADSSIPLNVENAIAKAELPFIFASPATTNGLLYISPSHFASDYAVLSRLGVVKKGLPVARLVEPLSSSKVKS